MNVSSCIFRIFDDAKYGNADVIVCAMYGRATPSASSLCSKVCTLPPDNVNIAIFAALKILEMQYLSLDTEILTCDRSLIYKEQQQV